MTWNPPCRRPLLSWLNWSKEALPIQMKKRMVGHYWLRNAQLAPTTDMASEIAFTIRAIGEFANHIHSATITAPSGNRFTRMLIVGIGGSALGPQFVAMRSAQQRIGSNPYFFDNTDPDGMDRVLAEMAADLKSPDHRYIKEWRHQGNKKRHD